MNRDRRIPHSLRRQILDANCAYCGDPWPNEVDHVLPFSRGGTSDRDNLVAACEPCNREKLDFTPEEWRAWRESQGMPWPPKGRHALIREFVDEAIAGGTVTLEEMAAAAKRLSTFSVTAAES